MSTAKTEPAKRGSKTTAPRPEAAGFDEHFERWGRGVLLVAFVLALVVGFQVPEARPVVASGLVLAVPSLLALLAWTRLRGVGAFLPWSWVAVGAATCIASAVAASHSLFPAPPIDEATLGGSGVPSELHVPDDGQPFILEVHGRIAGRAREGGEVRYELALARGDARAEAHGTLRRSVSRAPARRRGPPTTTVARHETVQHELALAGHGPATITLTSVEGTHGALHASVRKPWVIDTPWLVTFGALGLALLGLEIASARAHTWTPLLAVGASALVLGHYVVFRWDADQPMVGAIGALAVAAGGAVAGFGVGAGVGWLVRAKARES